MTAKHPILSTYPALKRLLLIVLAAAGCDRIRPDSPDFTLPPVTAIDSVYDGQGMNLDVSFSGNVVELRAVQPLEQLRRGGSLWARVGPYIYLFAPATQQVFETWEGVAAVRAITLTPTGQEIARAMLLRTRFDETRWRRSANLLGHALREGTERPVRIEALVHWGEENTEHRYNPEFVPARRPRDTTSR